MRKLKLLFAALALLVGGVGSASAETDYTSNMPTDWTGSGGDFQGGREKYQTSNYNAGKILYQSFTAPAAGIYEIKFYAVTSSTSGRGFENIYGNNIAQAYATAGSNKATVAMEVIDQTGCTLVQDANIRTLSVEAAEGETIEYGIENIATGGNWYTIKGLSAKMKTVAEIFQDQYDEAYAIWQYSTENEAGARATFKTFVDALNTALTGTLAEAQTASDNLTTALVTYESKSYPVKGHGVKYDFTSKMNMAINAWTCKQGNGPAQYGYTGATETYGVNAAGEVMYQTITGLANGEYEIHFYAVANAANGEGTASEASAKKAYVYANDQTEDLAVIQQNSCTPSDYERTFTVMVTDGTIKYGITNNEVAGNWYICKNVVLYMTGAPDLSDYYDAIASKLTTANGLKSSPMKAIALSDLNDAINATDGYQSITIIGTLETLSANLTTAITAANTSIANYEEAKAVLDAASTLDAAGKASYAANETVTAIQAAYDARTLEAITSEQETACAAALSTAVRAQTSENSDWTAALVNPSFETGDFTAWTNSGMAVQNNNSFAKTGTSYAEKWEPNGTFSVKQTIADIPAGIYSISAKALARSAKSAKLFAADEEKAITIGETADDYTVEFLQKADGDLTFGFEGVGDGTSASWLCVDNFTMKFVRAVTLADASDYTALSEAITAAGGKTLGFETGEYAPYTNVAALKTLAAAKAIDKTASNAKSFVTAATTALTGATWTANTVQMNAVYNGTFALSTPNATSGVDVDMPGWTLVEGIRLVINNTTDYPGLTSASGSAAVFSWGGTALTYGEKAGYTMPLAGHTIYELTAKIAGWKDGDMPTRLSASVLKESEGMASMNILSTSVTKRISETDPFVTCTIKFVTDEAGDYVLSLSPNKNNVLTDISITKAANQYLEFADGSVPNYAPGTYPSVKITRSLTANRWATAVYPFAVSGVDNIATLTSYDKSTGALGFTTAATSTANVPFLMRSTAGASEISLNNVAVAAAAATDATASEASLKGVYAATPVDNSAKNYVLSNNTIYAIGANSATVNPYRAYIQIAQDAEARNLTFTVDGEVTAIEGITAGESGDGVVYNLQGQRVVKAQKGLYIKDGRKVMIK